MGTLHGTIIDAVSGESLDAKVHVLNASGNFSHPPNSMLKRGPGTPFFFCDGSFAVEGSRGRTDVLVERGTEYEPYRTTVELPANGRVEVEIPLRRWYRPQEDAWYPGNTHIHYDEKETRPDERLGIDCSVEGYNVTCVSVLDRRQLPYASNKYPIGVMNEFTTAHHVLDIGEENRHYGDNSPWGFGYGHVMLLNIRNLVQPVSRGHTLAGQFDPDYPPLCFCCDDAREQGGLVIWCHNGRGMEARWPRRWASWTPSTCSTPFGWIRNTISGTSSSTAACGYQLRRVRIGLCVLTTACTCKWMGSFRMRVGSRV